MTANKARFYTVWKGRRVGVYTTWAEAEAQVKGVPGAQFKAFGTRAEAERALRGDYRDHVGARPPTGHATERWKQLRLLGVPAPVVPSYSSDAASAGNPGIMEYRSVNTATGELLFERGPFPEGTNNIGEFLGIVETLMLLVKRSDPAPVYSDSRNALAWVAAKECKTQLPRSRKNAALFRRIAAAEKWLRAHTYPNRLLKWDTANWGEIPADYGRK